MRFVPSKLQVLATYSLGYGIPIVIVLATLATSIVSGKSHYLREYFDENGGLEEIVCWIDIESIIWSLIIPVSLMILFNFGVVILIANVAYYSSFHHSKYILSFN